MLKQITRNIEKVPESLKHFSEEKYEVEKAKNLATIFGSSTSSYEEQVLGGRLLIYSTTRTCLDTIAYLQAYKHRLNSKTYNFMLKYSDVITDATLKNNYRDYEQNDFFSASCISKQYLLKTSYDEEALESIQMMHMRQAVQFYSEVGINAVLKCYEELSQQLFTHASPTIFNSGTTMNQLSSCFLAMVGDNMDDISGAVGVITEVSKMNGGVGIHAGLLRHSAIGHVGVSEGPCGFLSIYDKTIGKVSQGGKRNGAGTAFLQSWHYDFANFVKMTDNFADHGSRFTDLNTCAWMDDLLYVRIKNAVEADMAKMNGETPDPSKKTYWTMFCPKKAERLQFLYGIDFIREYEKMEILAFEREKMYQESVDLVKNLHEELLNNNNEKVRCEYLKARILKFAASKMRIEHNTIDAYQLYKSIIKIQINSGMPYIMNGDPCQKSNQKNIGSIEQSNLCLEILEVARPASKTEPAEIASCNLGSMNIPKYVKNKMDWTKTDDYKTPMDCSEDLRNCYDFEKYGKAVMSLCRNLNKVIDTNYYPMDKHDKDGNVTHRGDISRGNLKTRPLGIGVSGQSDALYMMDIKYESKEHTMFNKMLYACKYFNALIMSLALAIRDGEYSEFRKGGFKKFVGIGEKGANADGMVYIDGSPLSNGMFQFDLWKEDAEMQKAHGLLNEKIYKTEDDEPLDPKIWGQKDVYIYVYNKIDEEKRKKEFCVEDSSRIEILNYKRKTTEYESVYKITPDWNTLKMYIKMFGVRNSLLIAVMPTASSANILRNCESTEAHQSMIYARDLKSGNYTLMVRHLYYDLRDLGLWTKELSQFIAACEGSISHIKHYIVDHSDQFPITTYNNDLSGLDEKIEKRLDFLIKKYSTMYEISQKYILTLARQRGIYICQSQSTNIYLKDPHPVQMEAIHIYANNLRLKTGMYYLRQSPAKSAGDFTLPAEMVLYVKKLLGFAKQGLIDNTIGTLKIETPITPPKIGITLENVSPVPVFKKEKSNEEISKLLCSIKNKEACIECQA